MSDTGNGYWVNPIKNKTLEDFMLITQGHEYVTEGEKVIVENSND